MNTLEGWLGRREKIVEERLLAEDRVIDGWRLVAFIGRGGNGEVWRARRESDGQIAALKILYRNDDTSRRRFARATDVLSGLRHPAFPTFFAKGEADGRPYLVMEELESGDLPRKEWEIIRFLRTLSAGVACLHDAGYIHRDLKPANILYRRDAKGRREPVVVDFGLLKRADPSSAAQPLSVTIVDGRVAAAGTPGVSAPEQFLGAGVTTAVDIHAMGMIAYFCFGGKLPPVWRMLVMRSTSSIPDQRYPTMRDFEKGVRKVAVRLIATWTLAIVLCAYAALKVIAALVWLIPQLLPAARTEPVRRDYGPPGDRTFSRPADVSTPSAKNPSASVSKKTPAASVQVKPSFSRHRTPEEDARIRANFTNLPDDVAHQRNMEYYDRKFGR